MIITSILNPIFNLLNSFVDKIAVTPTSLPDISGFGNIVGYSLYFFPVGMLTLIIGNFLMWYTLNFAWAIIEWIYKKIPGIS